MYVMTVEKRVSARALPIDAKKQPEDWFVLAGLPIPFVPTAGREILMPKENKTIKLSHVVWVSGTGIFWAEVKPLLKPEPDAKTAAEKLVDTSVWTRVCVASRVVEVRQELIAELIRELKSTILRSSTLPPGFMKQFRI